MFFIKIYIKESYMNCYHTSIQMCGQYCILAPKLCHYNISYSEKFNSYDWWRVFSSYSLTNCKEEHRKLLMVFHFFSLFEYWECDSSSLLKFGLMLANTSLSLWLFPCAEKLIIVQKF